MTQLVKKMNKSKFISKNKEVLLIILFYKSINNIIN